MVPRKTGWRVVTLAVAVYAAASADGVFARALGRPPPLPKADIPNVAPRAVEPAEPLRSQPDPGWDEPPIAAESLPPAEADPALSYDDPPAAAGGSGGGTLVWGGPMPAGDGYVPSPAFGDPVMAEPFAESELPPAVEADPVREERAAAPVEVLPAETAAPSEPPDPDEPPTQYGRTYPVRDLVQERRGQRRPRGPRPAR